MSTARGIGAIRLVGADVDRLARFYADAFGFTPTDAPRHGARAADPAPTRSRALRLGRQTIELIAFELCGAPYPAGTASFDLRFQHFAIVVGDMKAAMARLSAVPGWTPISRDGPETLPERSGGVSAFKFRDPEGHPLELLAFPSGGVPERWRTHHGDGPCLGIDHTAISVSDTAASLAFYARLGFAKVGHSLNHGPEQDRLDGADGVDVDVTRLEVADADPPALELLCYRGVARGTADRPSLRDVAATQIVLGALRGVSPELRQALRRDPDGHIVVAP